MSNIRLIIEERPSDIGNFLVGRLLPFRQKRMVGSFIFIDHMGPAELGPDENLDVPPHPHIGLSTLTFLFEGAIMHRDSMGVVQEITPGQVNWMTAGQGVVHSERTPEHLRGKPKKVHGLQIWVALPKELEEMEPSFYHANEDQLPTWTENGLSFKLIAGTIGNRSAPVPVHSPLYFLEIKAQHDAVVDLQGQLYGESGLYILEGTVKTDGHTFEPKQLLVAKEASLCAFEITAGSVVYIFGGEPFPEERFIYWNMVSSDAERLEASKTRWQEQAFPKIPGETDFVPLPQPKI